MNLKSFWYILLSLCLKQLSYAQNMEPIKLINPSFEDIPRASTVPRGWNNCGMEMETPPDTQPSGQFEVTKKPYKGATYLGMVTRDNDTWESVSQRMPRAFEKGTCYAFSIYLCRSDIYKSRSSSNPTVEANYVTPIKLRIWGSSTYYDKQELLGETSEVKNIDWQEYKFEFRPKQAHNYIILEAFFKTPVLFPYNGNILVDNASDIVPFNCGKKPVAKVDKPKTTNGTPATTTGTNPPTTSAKTRYENAKVGESVRIENLYFKADSASVQPESFKVLDELYQFMSGNPDVVIEVGGHTNNIPTDDFCNRLSTLRAKEVSDYLIGRGISETRIRYRGYGKTQPVVPNVNSVNRARNQRVEIKILSRGK